jgi:predicted dinucleotide-utilizing enzyme
VPEILEDRDNGLPETMRRLLERLRDDLKEMDRQIRLPSGSVASVRAIARFPCHGK